MSMVVATETRISCHQRAPSGVAGAIGDESCPRKRDQRAVSRAPASSAPFPEHDDEGGPRPRPGFVTPPIRRCRNGPSAGRLHEAEKETKKSGSPKPRLTDEGAQASPKAPPFFSAGGISLGACFRDTTRRTVHGPVVSTCPQKTGAGGIPRTHDGAFRGWAEGIVGAPPEGRAEVGKSGSAFQSEI